MYYFYFNPRPYIVEILYFFIKPMNISSKEKQEILIQNSNRIKTFIFKNKKIKNNNEHRESIN